MSGDPLSRAAAIAQAYLAGAASRPVGIPVDRDVLRERLGGDLPERGEDPADVLDRLAQAADPGIVGTAGPRYFGFVVGGALPAAIGADCGRVAHAASRPTPRCARSAAGARQS